MLLSLFLLATAPASDAVIARSSVEAVIPVEVRLAEAIAVDGDRLFTGSVVDGGVWIKNGKRWRKLEAEVPAGAVLAAAFDRRRGRLWLSVGTAEPYRGVASSFKGLIALDRKFRVVDRVVMPDRVNPGDLSVGTDGSVYVSGTANGGTFVCPPGCVQAQQSLTRDQAPSPQGIVPAPNGKLYIADYERGLLAWDEASRKAEPLANPGGAELRGLDGLVWWQGQLIAVQNGTRTKRILRIELDDAGAAVRSVRPIEQAHPEWGEPTLAVVKGDTLLYIADAQWEVWGERGQPRPDTSPRPTPIRRLQLRP